MSPLSRAGATCLLAAPLAGLASVLVERTLSTKATDLASAFTLHPTATHVGLAVNAMGTVLLAAGLLWFAWTTYRRSPRLAVAGGVLGLLGLFSIMVDDAVHIAGSLVVSGLPAAQAASLLGPLTSGGPFAAAVLSELADIGVIMLAVASLRIGVPRWGSAIVCLGVIAEAAGFATGSRYLAAVGFAAAFVGYATVVRTALSGTPAVPAPVQAPIAAQPV